MPSDGRVLGSAESYLGSNNQTNMTNIYQVTLVVQSSLSILAMAFHLLVISILLLQVRQDSAGKKTKKILSNEAERLLFVTGALLILFGLYLSQDGLEHFHNFLVRVYIISVGLIVGIVVLIVGCLLLAVKPSLMSRIRTICRLPPQQNVENNDRTGIEDDERQPLIAGNEENDLNESPRRRFGSTDRHNYRETNQHAPQTASGILLHQKQPFLGPFLAVTTFFIVLIEVIFIFSSKTSDTEIIIVTFYKHVNIFHLYNISTTIYLIQIIVQIICYIFLVKNCTISVKFVHSAEFLLKYMAFFNFTMVLNSLWDCSWKRTRDFESMQLIESLFKEGSNILYIIYSAMIVNTRVLFVYIFMEHAICLDIKSTRSPSIHDPIKELETPERNLFEEVAFDSFPGIGQQERHLDPLQNEAYQVQRTRLAGDKRLLRNIGICVGLAFVFLQCLMSAQYLQILGIGAWTNTFSVVVDIGVIVSGGVLVKRSIARAPNIVVSGNTLSFMRMINLMGIAGFMFCLLKTILIISMLYYYDGDDITKSKSFFTWDVVKNVSRVLAQFSLIVIINMLNQFASVLRDGQDLATHAFLPTLMLGVLSMAVGFAADQYVGDVNTFIRKIPDPSIEILLEFGAPLLLAFHMDVFFSLLIIFIKSN